MMGLTKQAFKVSFCDEESWACFLSLALKNAARCRQTGMHGDTQTHLFSHKHTCSHEHTLFALLVVSHKAEDTATEILG